MTPTANNIKPTANNTNKGPVRRIQQEKKALLHLIRRFNLARKKRIYSKEGNNFYYLSWRRWRKCRSSSFSLSFRPSQNGGTRIFCLGERWKVNYETSRVLFTPQNQLTGSWPVFLLRLRIRRIQLGTSPTDSARPELEDAAYSRANFRLLAILDGVSCWTFHTKKRKASG